MSFNKKGVTGELISTFIATIIIILILLCFVVLSGTIKAFSDDVRVDKDTKVGMGNIFTYFSDYNKFNDILYLHSQNQDIKIEKLIGAK